MITEKQIDALVQRLVDKVNDANTYFLEQIGTSIKKIGKLSSSKAQQLVQILKYGGNYEEIIKEISRITNLNISQVDAIFNEYAKKDQMFYKGFYDYRNVPFVEYANNPALKNQTMALANMVKNEIYNFTRENVLGYSFRDLDGNVVFKGIRETYNDLLDRALMNVGQGKETFDIAMRDVLRDIGGSGLKTIDYESGRSVRLDSAVRMHLKGRLRELHNENQKLIASEINADGVEISVHENPAPDHEDAQGHQLTIDEFEILQSSGTAKDVKGRIIDLHRELANGDTADDFRPISEMNCYHYIFAIVLGVSKPEYTDEQLEDIKRRNEEGFEYKGKHYTNYEGTQMQRKLETEIRKQKDIKTIGQASGDDKMVLDANNSIKSLRNRYNLLNEASGLKGKSKRMSVPRVKKVKQIEEVKEVIKEKPKTELLLSKYEKTSKIFAHSKQWLDLEDEDNIKIYNGTNELKVKIYERKNLQKAYYSRTTKEIHTTGVDTSNLNSKQATSTLWHETGHSLDNYKGGMEYASNNKDLRMKMFDWYRDNPDVPQKIQDYFANQKTRIDNKLKNEFSEKIMTKEEYSKKMFEKLKNNDWYKDYTDEKLNITIDNMYENEQNRYVRQHRYDDMDYAQRGCFSDMFSAISSGKYQWCHQYGYHTKSYYESRIENPSTELFANFTTLKMTGRKEQLALFKEVAPDIYDELDKLYKKIGDELNAKRINK